ncbi:MAG: hypothetical protein GY706_04005, partial [Bacteroides sp.]|nr:hypothetical protein [Bacteroides sp.]
MTDKLKNQFIEYDRDNPDIYRAFAAMARGFIQNREKRGAKAIIELVRPSVPMRPGGVRHKVNNSYTAYYARKFENEYPQHKGYFE